MPPTDPISSGKFTYSSSGFLYDAVPRSTPAAVAKSLSASSTTTKWLKAQLAHYAVRPLTGSKDELERRLRCALGEGKIKAQPKEMKDMERGLKKAWEARGGAVAGVKGPGGRVEKAKPKPKLKKEVKIGRVKKGPPKPGPKKEVKAGKTREARPKPQSKPQSRPKQTARRGNAKKGHKPQPPSTRRPRSAFADQILGTYTSLTCDSIPTNQHEARCLTITRSRYDADAILMEIIIGPVVDAVCKLDFVPKAKATKVGFGWQGKVGNHTGEGRGEAEFAIIRKGMRVKGRFEEWFQGQSGFGGRVTWTGVREEGGGNPVIGQREYIDRDERRDETGYGEEYGYGHDERWQDSDDGYGEGWQDSEDGGGGGYDESGSEQKYHDSESERRYYDSNSEHGHYDSSSEHGHRDSSSDHGHYGYGQESESDTTSESD